MLVSLAVFILSQYPSVDCEVVNGTLTNYTPPGPYQNISCPSNKSAATGSCPAGQFATAATISGLTCAAPPSAPTLVIAPGKTTRSLNAVFTPSATRAMALRYYISFACASTLLVPQTSSVEIFADTNTTPTTSRGVVSFGVSGVVASLSTTLPLVAEIEPNWNVRLVSSGSCNTVSLANVNETPIYLN